MSLTPGTPVGPYQIISAIGAGGMGEVYRAKDTQLGRLVAIKVLPDSLSADPERLARFRREAQVLASLNHPNIAHIHGYEESNGIHALVMELVDGPTLAARLTEGPIPLKEALSISTQIAEALEAAHGQGVIHRDLKPANITVRADGTVKVLDFGLAKVVAAAAAADIATSLQPTITSPAMTQAGVVLGTAAYMAPEQARGRPVDKRADIWAFGCVLFELLTGRPAFAGETVTDVFVALLEREPAWDRLPERTPDGVRRLARRCLAKDVRARLQDIGDARLELLDASVEPAAASVPAGPQASARRGIRATLALVITALGAVTLGWFAGRRATPLGGDLLPNANIDQVTYDAGVTRMPALSFDGRLLAYASDRAGDGNLDIWLQQLGGGNPLRLTDDPADDMTPEFSPDGREVVFRSERNGGGVYVVSTLGGPARLIAPDGRRPRFSPDGKQVAYWVGQFRGQNAFAGQSSVYVVALSGGTPVRMLADFPIAKDPVWSPDGRSLLVAGRPDQTSRVAESFDWWLVPLGGTRPAKVGIADLPLTRGAGIAPERWTPSGVLFSYKEDLWSIALSNAGRVSGPPRRLTLGVGPYIEPAAGPDGQIVFSRLVAERVIERASITKLTEPAARLYADSGTSTWRASETSDGSLIVFERGVEGAREIWVKHTRSGRQELVTRVPGGAPLNATVSGDGARIAYTRNSDVTGGSAGTGFVIETAGGVPRKVCDGCALHGFLADHHSVLAALTDGHAIRVIDVRTGNARDLVVAPPGERLDRPHASPDDRWLAFRRQSHSAGKSFVVRLSLDHPISAEGLRPIDEPTTTGRPCGWSPDARTLYLLLDTDGFRCLWAQRIDPVGAPVGNPIIVRHFHSTKGISTSFGDAITADGFLYEAAEESANVWKLTPARQP
jgi:Tol biopolymer transport system component